MVGALSNRTKPATGRCSGKKILGAAAMGFCNAAQRSTRGVRLRAAQATEPRDEADILAAMFGPGMKSTCPPQYRGVGATHFETHQRMPHPVGTVSSFASDRKRQARARKIMRRSDNDSAGVPG
jgi:hypothetical protein